MLKEKIPKTKYKSADYNTTLTNLQNQNWTKADAPNDDCYYMTWLHNEPSAMLADGVTSLTIRYSIIECQAMASSYYLDESGHFLYVHRAAGANPEGYTSLTATYSLLESRADGMPKPWLYGTKKGIVPVCINVDTLQYQWQEQASLDLVSVESEGVILSEGNDYTKDLATSTITLTGTPKLQPNTKYWFVISGDFAVSGTNYMRFAGSNSGSGYYVINGDDPPVWSAGSGGLCWHIYGKETLEEEKDQMKVEWIYWESWNYNYKLRDATTHTRIAQEFTTPNNKKTFFVTKIKLYAKLQGTPSGKITAQIYSSKSPEVAHGGISQEANAGDFTGPIKFTPRGVASNVTITATGIHTGSDSIERVDKIIEDAYARIGGTAATLDSLAALGTARPEKLAIYLDSEMEFGEFLSRLEAQQLFKFIPKTSERKYMVMLAGSGQSAVANFRDEDFESFSSGRLWKSIFQTIKINYDSDSATHLEPRMWEKSSTIAEYFYRNKESLTIDTFFKEKADAVALSEAYSHLLEYPLYYVEFEIAGGYGLVLVPFQVITITRERADSVTGSLDAAAFRIISVSKSVVTGRTKIVAIQDSQSYYES